MSTMTAPEVAPAARPDFVLRSEYENAMLEHRLTADISRTRESTAVEFAAVRGEISHVREDMANGFAQVRKDMADEFKAVRGDITSLRSDFKALPRTLFWSVIGAAVTLIGVTAVAVTTIKTFWPHLFP